MSGGDAPHLGDLLAVQIVSRLREGLHAERRADHNEEKRDAKQYRVSFQPRVKR